MVPADPLTLTDEKLLATLLGLLLSLELLSPTKPPKIALPVIEPVEKLLLIVPVLVLAKPPT